MKKRWISATFLVAGIYDVILAAAFLFAAGPIMQRFGVEPPNHPGYVQFPALLVLIFSAMYFRIASNPVKYRELIVYGAALKVAYCLTVLWNQMTGSIPALWLPLAWIDFVFLIFFYVSWRGLAQHE